MFSGLVEVVDTCHDEAGKGAVSGSRGASGIVHQGCGREATGGQNDAQKTLDGGTVEHEALEGQHERAGSCEAQHCNV